MVVPFSMHLSRRRHHRVALGEAPGEFAGIRSVRIGEDALAIRAGPRVPQVADQVVLDQCVAGGSGIVGPLIGVTVSARRECCDGFGDSKASIEKSIVNEVIHGRPLLHQAFTDNGGTISSRSP